MLPEFSRTRSAFRGKNFLCAIFSDGAKNNARRFYGLFDEIAAFFTAPAVFLTASSAFFTAPAAKRPFPRRRKKPAKKGDRLQDLPSFFTPSAASFVYIYNNVKKNTKDDFRNLQFRQTYKTIFDTPIDMFSFLIYNEIENGYR